MPYYGTLGGQLVGLGVGGYGITHSPQNGYGPASQILNSLGEGITLTDTFAGGAATAAGFAEAYEATGLALGRAGGALGAPVAADRQGMPWNLSRKRSWPHRIRPCEKPSIS